MNVYKIRSFRLSFCLGCMFLWFGSLHSQSKNEMRGVWMATLLNIDWPSDSRLSTQQQKQEIISILDHHQSVGINAVFLQVRPAGDAFYNSSYEPWSKWLTGIQGKEPRPYYDPLKFWIEECHFRGMELHAWFNPFRAAVNEDITLLHQDHVVRKQPQWFVNYGGRIYFNPGLAEVREYVKKVVMEVVKQYDIDGIHFDDYFYPYKINGQEFSDQHTFQQEGRDFSSIADWRRNNISTFIEDVGAGIGIRTRIIQFLVSPHP